MKRAGKLRASQIVTQFGPGCLVDLPELSMVLAGLDDWNTTTSWVVKEPRLQRALGVRHFRTPPYLDVAKELGGVPARVFPRFLVCPRCNLLAPHSDFEFTERGSRHICRAGDCSGNGKARAFPARFMVACPKGHLDDFPWHHWVHPDIADCNSRLRFEDSAKTGSLSDLSIFCNDHQRRMSLASAFGKAGASRLPACSGNRPWLSDHDPEPCDKGLRVLLRGASNAYFAVTASALSIPPWSNPLQSTVAQHETEMAKADSLDGLKNALKYGNYPDLEAFDPEQIWSALQQLRGVDEEDEVDLRIDEYQAFVGATGPADYRSEFKVVPIARPASADGVLDKVIKAVRLREVRALRGFTRIDSIPDIGEMGEVSALEAGLAPLATQPLDWLPGAEMSGEGIFVTLDSSALENWESDPNVVRYNKESADAQRSWHAARGAIVDPKSARFSLVHSLAHLLIRRLELEAGYAGSSIRERIYVGDDMAGFLIYTATPDSEGTLGGLVELARPEDLGPMLDRAFEGAKLCANDPFCSSRQASDAASHLNGAACHACLLLPETSCEHGNHFLDRTLVVPTLRQSGVPFVNR
ncbi:DUF1998 domain-containing protein [Acidimicrobiaceae bacterium]|nr:DUF1998 domain-containing protein [Acidimicrobiaceae bacterium]